LITFYPEERREEIKIPCCFIILLFYVLILIIYSCRFIMHITRQSSFEEWEGVFPTYSRREIEDKEKDRKIY